MEKKKRLSCILRPMDKQRVTIDCRQVRGLFSSKLLAALTSIARNQPGGIYLAGGTVRDLLLGREPADVDLTVSCHGKIWARELARLTGGAFVELGREEDAGRVVGNNEITDFSSFRAGAVTIDDELTKRDLTINGLGLCLDPLVDSGHCGDEQELTVIDPRGGVRDIRSKVIRLCSKQSIIDDPLRLLRVFRFAASLGFTIVDATLAEVKGAGAISTAAAGAASADRHSRDRGSAPPR